MPDSNPPVDEGGTLAHRRGLTSAARAVAKAGFDQLDALSTFPVRGALAP